MLWHWVLKIIGGLLMFMCAWLLLVPKKWRGGRPIKPGQMIVTFFFGLILFAIGQ